MIAFQNWLTALEKRHLAALTFAEVSRALRALSSTYVERRSKIREGHALSGAGKRAAFALFYGPLHFLLVEEIAARLAIGGRSPSLIVDLGCGTGAAGAAVATTVSARRVLAIDRSQWALDEAVATCRQFGLSASVRRGDIATRTIPGERSTFVAAFAINELAEAAREDLMTRLLARAGRGDRLLVVEPLAGFVAPWWNRWRERVEALGGRGDEWRVTIERPAIVAKLDRATGLDHRVVTGRSLWLGS